MIDVRCLIFVESLVKRAVTTVTLMLMIHYEYECMSGCIGIALLALLRHGQRCCVMMMCCDVEVWKKMIF